MSVEGVSIYQNGEIVGWASRLDLGADVEIIVDDGTAYLAFPGGSGGPHVHAIADLPAELLTELEGDQRYSLIHSHDYATFDHNHAGVYAASAHTHVDGDLPASITRDAELTAAIDAHAATPHGGSVDYGEVTDIAASAFGDTALAGALEESARADHRHAREANPVTAHESASHPHAGYQRTSEKGAANGYPSLGGDGKIPDGQIPDGIARDSELPDLAAHLNDTTAAHAASAISVSPAGGIAAVTVQAAIEELDVEKAAAGHGHATDWAETVDVTTQAFGDAAAAGALDEVARADHRHGMPANPVTGHEAAADPHPAYLREDLVDAKGDLIVATAADTPARLPVGANGQVLSADSTVAAGVRWVNPSGGGGSSAWTTVVKTADEAKNNSAAVADDTALRLTLAADSQYTIRLRAHFQTNATADLKYRLVFTGTTTRVRRLVRRTATTDIAITVELKTTFDAADVVLSTTGLNPWVEEEILLRVGAAGGELKLQWAQVTSGAGPTICMEGSYIESAAA